MRIQARFNWTGNCVTYGIRANRVQESPVRSGIVANAVAKLKALGVPFGPECDVDALMTRLVGEGWQVPMVEADDETPSFATKGFELCQRIGMWDAGSARWQVEVGASERAAGKCLGRSRTLAVFVGEVVLEDLGTRLGVDEHRAVSEAIARVVLGDTRTDWSAFARVDLDEARRPVESEFKPMVVVDAKSGWLARRASIRDVISDRLSELAQAARARRRPAVASLAERARAKPEADYERFSSEYRARMSAHDDAPSIFDYLDREQLAADGERIFRADLSELQEVLEGAEVEATFREIQAERFATTHQCEAAE